MIPKTFHRIWVGGEEPLHLAQYAQTWTQHHPGWDLKQWGEREIADLFPLTNQDLYDRAPEVCPRHVGQLRSDIVRLEILQRFGGVYIDADFECCASIEETIEGTDCFAAWEIQNKVINNAILGATPDHPFIAGMIAALPSRAIKFKGYKPNRISGPRCITDLHRLVPGLLTVLDQKLFYPYGFDELDREGEDFPDALAIHHWNNKRRGG